jgi:hypothetical protein
MATRRRSIGGTLAFVAALGLLLVLLGIAFFFYQMITGGGTELQRATDAGNLNVAKQALRSPGFALSGNELNEFGDLTDTNGQVNLLTFNRLVGKATIVALNAQAQQTPQSRQNAQAIMAMLEGNGGIGSRLANQLSTHSNLNGFFQNVSMQNSLRMLGSPNTQDVSGETQNAFMKSNAASNVFIGANQIPGGLNFANDSSSVFNLNGKLYLRGYTNLNTGAVRPVAVPLRPGEQPHGVSLDEFGATVSQTPFIGTRANPLLPPNAFRSGGTATERLQTNNQILTRACAVVGSLNLNYPAMIPRGFILVDNAGASLSGPVQTLPSPPGRAPDMFVALMNIVNAAQSNGRTYISENADYNDLRQRINNAQGTDMQSAREAAATQWLSDGNFIDSPSNFTATQLVTDFGPGSNPTIFNCDNTPASIGGPPCNQLQDELNNTYSPSRFGPPNQSDNLMAIERFKALVLEIRHGVDFGGSACRTAFGNYPCTGLKKYPLDIRSNPSQIPFGEPNPTIRELFNQMSNGIGPIESDMRIRMRQIDADATDAQINAVFNSSVPFGQIRIIFRHPNTQNLVIAPVNQYPNGWQVPQNIDFDNPNSQIPDGPMAQAQRQANVEGFTHGGGLINLPSEGGYPNPWDCPPGAGAITQDNTQWRPHSGANNLLGVLRFRNCASGGGQWCCPC